MPTITRMDRRSRTSGTSRCFACAERGFTLVEMTVAIALSGIIIAVAVSGITGALSGSTTSRAGGVSAAAMSRTLDQFEDDIAAAETKDRADGQLRDMDDLARAVRSGASVAPSDPARPPSAVVDVQDLVYAANDEVWIVADVSQAAGGARHECVRWRAHTVGSEFRITRTVLRNSSQDPYAPPCAGDVTDTRVMMRSPNAAVGLSRFPFSYSLRCDPGACGAGARHAGRACATWDLPAAPRATRWRLPDTARTTWVVGVRASFAATSQQGRASAISQGMSTASIRSRSTEAYIGALGCGQQ